MTLPGKAYDIHHSIVLGQGAYATQSYEFALCFVTILGEPPVRFSTIMTPDEYEVVVRVVTRLLDISKAN